MQNSVLRKVFRLTLASYFVANLMTVLDLNNLLIIIRKEPEKEKPGDAEEAQELRNKDYGTV